jgi:hypothetical protein
MQPSALQSALARPEGNCITGKPCVLTGQLGIRLAAENYSTAYIDLKDKPCLPLLLSEMMFRKYQRLDGKSVSLTGEALPKVAVTNDVINIQYRDRWLQTGFCGESVIVVYVDSLKRTKP